MIPLEAYRGKKIGVFGLGKAGKAAVAALEASGAEVYADDDNQQPATRNYNTWPWSELAALILSPGVPLTHPAPHEVVLAAKAAGCPIVGEIELLQQACPNAFKISITGTNGKSTTTALIGHILSEAGRNPQVGGNLGTPALALEMGTVQEVKSGDFASPKQGQPIFVLEMSSYQLDLMHTVRFNVAVWLNITPDHLDRHGDMEGYVAAKKHIFERQETVDVAVVGIDDAYSEAVARELIASGKQTVVPVTVGGKAENGIEVTDGVLLDRRDGARINLREGKLKGAHNWQNIAAAYVACRAAGVDVKIISQAILSFGGLEHRMEWVKDAGAVAFVNDSKATNADSTSKALAAYPSDIYWILGGRPKAGGITSLGKYFPRIAHAYLLGEAEAEFAETLQGKVPYTRCGTLEAATRAAVSDALRAGKGTVLLSPACASWDQWPNFEARGVAFKDYVNKIVNENAAGGQEADPAQSCVHCGAQQRGAGALYEA